MPQLGLQDLMCRVFKRQVVRQDEIMQYSVGRAIEGSERRGIKPEDLSILRALHEGRESIENIRQHSSVVSIISLYEPKAANNIRDREAKKYGRTRFAKNTWEVTVERVIPAAMRVNSRFYVNDQSHDFAVRQYCLLVLHGKAKESDPFVRAVELLDDDNFGDDLLEHLWSECGNECDEIGLPSSLKQETAHNLDASEDDAWLSCSETAQRYRVDAEKLRKRLERYRSKNHDCFREIGDSERTAREARYLYRLSAVKHIVDGLQASAKRPPKKNAAW